MKRWQAVLLVAVFILGGWSSAEQAKAGEALYQQINKVDRLVEKGQWEQAGKEAKTLQKIYSKKEWQIQLLGDESEYEGIDNELEKLKAAIQTKDVTESKMRLSAIAATLKAVYSF